MTANILRFSSDLSALLKTTTSAVESSNASVGEAVLLNVKPELREVFSVKMCYLFCGTMIKKGVTEAELLTDAARFYTPGFILSPTSS